MSLCIRRDLWPKSYKHRQEKLHSRLHLSENRYKITSKATKRKANAQIYSPRQMIESYYRLNQLYIAPLNVGIRNKGLTEHSLLRGIV